MNLPTEEKRTPSRLLSGKPHIISLYYIVNKHVTLRDVAVDTPKPRNNQKLAAVFGLVVIVAAIGAGVAFLAPKSDGQVIGGATSPTPTATADATPTAATTSAAYKDGTYTANGSYDSPGGLETVHLSVTLVSGLVSDSNATTTGNNPTGRLYQGKFLGGYKGLVVGRNVDSIKLSRVSGSSLTSGGFNDALAKIKTQAKA